MIIKKFQATTEAEAIVKAKEEMGNSAVVLNIKTIKHRGISRLFKKNVVEVTAALDEIHNTGNIPTKSINISVNDKYKPAQNAYNMENHQEKASVIEEKLNNLQSMLESRMQANVEGNSSSDSNKNEIQNEEVKDEDSINLKFLKLVYNQLLDNEVNEIYANQIVGEIQTSLKREASVDSILSAVYQKIVLKIGQPKAIEPEENKNKLVFFVGPTGVGKTTTIAKLASHFKLEKKMKVALITLDTYRIAAVEQLRTYAGILDVPLQVVYTIEEFNLSISMLSDYDLVLIDTAGRSHRNNEQCAEIMHLIEDCKINENSVKETYLVLSAATKYKDLLKINEAFSTIKNYNIIFTKLDETTCLGNILNMKLKTDVAISYVTSGQVVPDDIGILDPQKIARSLLGGNE